MSLFKTLKILGFITLICLSMTRPGLADEPILLMSTTHPQVAAVLNQIRSLPSPNQGQYMMLWNAKSLYGDQVNVHDFEPTIKDLKKLKEQENLIAGPIGDQKWLAGAKAKGLLPKNTLMIEFPKLKNDHFWLYPEGGCLFEKQIYDYFLKIKMIMEPQKPLSTPYCDWITIKAEKIGRLLKKKKVERVVLAHSALEPLMKSFGIEVLTLMQHDHDKEVSPKTLKRLSVWLAQNKPVLAINEKGFPTPHQLEEKKMVTTLEWSPLQTRPHPLESLYIELIGAL
jgi:hypothetical protein